MDSIPSRLPEEVLEEEEEEEEIDFEEDEYECSVEEMHTNDEDGGGGDYMRHSYPDRPLQFVENILNKPLKPIEEIIKDHALHLLPVPSLHRFSSVSPSWRKHISNPFFAHTQSLYHRSLSGLFFNSAISTQLPTFYLPFEPSSAHTIAYPTLDFLPCRHVLVKASSRGLICCFGFFNCAPAYYICNPSTRDWTWKGIPRITSHDGVALVFEPSNRHFIAVYDLVCTSLTIDEEPKDGSECVDTAVSRNFDVFSSKDGRWRFARQDLKNPPLLLSSHGVSAGGKAYWRTTEGTILSFDPENDVCKVIGIPDEASGWCTIWELGELGGRLCCVTCDGVSAAEWSVGVFVLEEEEEGERTRWRKVRSLEEVAGEDMRPLMCEGGDVVLWVDGVVVARNLTSGSGRLLCNPAGLAVDSSECLPYTSSFVSLGNLD